MFELWVEFYLNLHGKFFKNFMKIVCLEIISLPNIELAIFFSSSNWMFAIFFCFLKLRKKVIELWVNSFKWLFCCRLKCFLFHFFLKVKLQMFFWSSFSFNEFIVVKTFSYMNLICIKFVNKIVHLKVQLCRSFLTCSISYFIWIADFHFFYVIHYSVLREFASFFF